jgi:Tfp pilus assembly protein PilO
MKIKILIIPFTIVLSITALIWFIYPMYSNDLDGAKEKYAELQKEREKFSDIENKIANADKLYAELQALPQRDILYRYIPEEKKEEEIVDNLNFLASSSGLSIFSMAIKSSKSSGSASLVSGDSDVSLAKAGSLPSPSNISANLSLAGNYESIKKFLESVSKLERYKEFVSLKLEKISGSEKEVAPDVLKMTVGINFNFLEKAKLSEADANNAVFLANKPNMKAIIDIENAKNREVLKLDVTAKGKTNLFTP